MRIRLNGLVLLLALAADPAFAAEPAAAPCDGKACMQILVFGDPQPKSTQDVDYFARDIVAAAMRERSGAWWVCRSATSPTTCRPCIRA